MEHPAASAQSPTKAPGQSPVTFAAYFTTKNGTRIYAKDYGHKAWPIGRR